MSTVVEDQCHPSWFDLRECSQSSFSQKRFKNIWETKSCNNICPEHPRDVSSMDSHPLLWKPVQSTTICLLLSCTEMGRWRSDRCLSHRSMELVGLSLHCYIGKYISSWVNIFLNETKKKKMILNNGHRPRDVSWFKPSFTIRHISNTKHWAESCWILYYINREVLIWNLLLQHPLAAFGLGGRSRDYFRHTTIAW